MIPKAKLLRAIAARSVRRKNAQFDKELRDARAALERKDAEIARLRAALEKIASYATNPGDEDYMQRIARTALQISD